MFDSFVAYQRKLQAEFQRMQKENGFEVINANLKIETIQRELRKKIGAMLNLSQ
jgi:thymidylate kinase